MKDLTNTGTSIIVFWWFGDVSVQEKFERGDGCGLLYVLWEVVPGNFQTNLKVNGVCLVFGR